MPLIEAPPEREFTLVATSDYPSTVTDVKAEDFRNKPDQFGNSGHHALTFTWQLDDMEDDQGKPITLRQTFKFETGDYLIKRGPRTGRLPMMTEITRAFGMPDILPRQTFDTDKFLGQRAILSVILEPKGDGGQHNRINVVSPITGSANGSSKVIARKPIAGVRAATPGDTPRGTHGSNEDEISF